MTAAMARGPIVQIPPGYLHPGDVLIDDRSATEVDRVVVQALGRNRFRVRVTCGENSRVYGPGAIVSAIYKYSPS